VKQDSQKHQIWCPSMNSPDFPAEVKQDSQKHGITEWKPAESLVPIEPKASVIVASFKTFMCQNCVSTWQQCCGHKVQWQLALKWLTLPRAQIANAEWNENQSRPATGKLRNDVKPPTFYALPNLNLGQVTNLSKPLKVQKS
jgi:hypothetical protein